MRSSEHTGSLVRDLCTGSVIPEAIAFSIIAGVDPKIGLYASFSMAVVIAFAGGRPGMISAATGAMALLMVNLVKDHGLQYLLAATLLCGVLQILAGYLRLGSLMRFVSRSVVTGFVNALAILIFMAQLPELTDVGWPVYAMTAAGGAWAVKVGAEGVYSGIHRESGLAFSLKVRDGATRAAEAAMLWVLGDLGFPVPVSMPPITNAAGDVVGEIRVKG